MLPLVLELVVLCSLICLVLCGINCYDMLFGDFFLLLYYFICLYIKK